MSIIVSTAFVISNQYLLAAVQKITDLEWDVMKYLRQA